MNARFNSFSHGKLSQLLFFVEEYVLAWVNKFRNNNPCCWRIVLYISCPKKNKQSIFLYILYRNRVESYNVEAVYLVASVSPISFSSLFYVFHLYHSISWIPLYHISLLYPPLYSIYSMYTTLYPMYSCLPLYHISPCIPSVFYIFHVYHSISYVFLDTPLSYISPVPLYSKYPLNPVHPMYSIYFLCILMDLLYPAVSTYNILFIINHSDI